MKKPNNGRDTVLSAPSRSACWRTKSSTSASLDEEPAAFQPLFSPGEASGVERHRRSPLSAPGGSQWPGSQ
jgi:hypothetical protein